MLVAPHNATRPPTGVWSQVFIFFFFFLPGMEMCVTLYSNRSVELLLDVSSIQCVRVTVDGIKLTQGDSLIMGVNY